VGGGSSVGEPPVFEANPPQVDLPGGSPENFVHPPLPENPEVRSRLEQKTGPLPSTLAALIPGARWESKTFPAELFAAVANRVSAERPETVFCVIGGHSDLILQQKIAENLDPGVKFLPTAGQTSLAEMMELLRGCEFAVSNDSGPVHAAAALGVPVFGLFGPTAPEKTGPYGPDHRVYQCTLACIKCLKRVCPLRGEEHQLCHKLDPQTIADDILNYLKKQEKSL
jgi:heptosyltransferase-1/heptosyltransferase-2